VLREFPESESALLVFSRERALEIPYSAAAAMFYYRDPILGFNRGNQQLLLAALKGATDPELALKLGVSVTAVKKRWLSIFTKFEKVKPEFLGLSASQPVIDSKRGLQKRHRVLSYVRAHPEELRPYLGAKQRGSKAWATGI
jgi:hypothetical protein